MMPPTYDVDNRNNSDNEQPSSSLPLEEEEESPSTPAPPRFCPLDTNEETSDEARKKIQDSRTNFAILHFALTVPKYSFSLFLFLAAGCVPMRTPREAIHKPLANLKTLARMEAQSYSTCVEEVFEQVLTFQLEELAQTEYTRAMKSQDQNRKRIQIATNMAKDCSMATNLAKRSLQTWQTVNEVEDFPSQICSTSDQEVLDSFLGNASSLLVEDEITSQLEAYTLKSTHSMQLVQDFARNRIQYDYDYFVTSRIQPTLQLLQGTQTSIGNMTFPVLMDHEDVSLRVQDSLQDLEHTLEMAKTHIDNLSLRLQDYRQSIEAFYQHYQDIFNRLKNGAEFVIEFLPPGSQIPSMFEMGNLPKAQSLLPQFYHFPADEFALQTLEIMDQTKAKFITLLEEMYVEVEQRAKHHLRGHSMDLMDQIDAFLHMEGYDPPKFQGHAGTLEAELQYVQSLGKQMHQSATQALGPLKQLYRQQVSSSTFPANFTSGAWDQSSVSASNVLPPTTTTFDYLKPIFPDISIPEILQLAFSWILSNAWIVETIIQAVRLWILEAKYAKGAIPDLPVLDYEEEFLSRTFDNGESRSLALLFKTLLSAFASPLYWLALVLIPLTLGIMVIWRPHVQQSCVDSRTGTYLANNFFAPLLINGANAPGHVLYLKGETECHQSKQSICNDMQVQFEATLHSDSTTARALEIHRNESTQTVHALERCIDLSLNAGAMDQACCGLKGYGTQECNVTDLVCPLDELAPHGEAASFRPVMEYIGDESCLTDKFPLNLEDARFNCSALSNACLDIPCNGVNEGYLLAKTIETDCQIEMYVLDCCSFVIVVVYQIFAVSLICTMLFQGIRQLFWRKLCPDGVRFHTQLCENGDLAFGDSKMDRFERMSVTIQRYERNGKFKLRKYNSNQEQHDNSTKLNLWQGVALLTADCLGVGVLALPYDAYKLGWSFGLSFLIINFPINYVAGNYLSVIALDIETDKDAQENGEITTALGETADNAEVEMQENNPHRRKSKRTYAEVPKSPSAEESMVDEDIFNDEDIGEENFEERHDEAIQSPTSSTYDLISITDQVFHGPQGARLVALLYYTNIFLVLGDYLLVMSRAVSAMLEDKICLPIAGLIASLLMFAICQLKTMANLGRKVSAVSLLAMVIVLGQCLYHHRTGSAMSVDVAETENPSIRQKMSALASIAFAVGSQKLFLNIRHELKDRKQASKTLGWSLTSYGATYLLVILFAGPLVRFCVSHAIISE
ncbi:MAG: hypothetical protein SGBAC_004720 [Bacillariaceae sp.]